MRYILLIFGLLFAQIGFSQKYVTKKTAPEKALKFYTKGKQYARSGEYKKAIWLRDAPDKPFV